MPWLRAYCAASRGGSCATAHNCQPSGYVSRSRLTYGNAVSHVPHVVLKKTRRVGWPPASFGREYSLPSTPRRVKCGASAPVSSNQQLLIAHHIHPVAVATPLVRLISPKTSRADLLGSAPFL